MQDFLLHICGKQLLGAAAELTEQRIGEQVFRRSPGYSPGEDNIVRNYARLLRGRLEDYFASEGAAEPVVIVVPRGRYIPSFVERSPVAPLPTPGNPEACSVPDSLPLTPKATDLSQESKGSLLSRSYGLPWILLCSALLLCSLWCYETRARVQRVDLNPFWQTFFNSAQDTYVVPADDGLVLYENLTAQRVALADYVRGDYVGGPALASGKHSKLVQDLASRRYTSVVDLQSVSRLSGMQEVVRNRFFVRYARELTLDDLKQGNAILLGGPNSNPWAELFQQEQNFYFERDATTGRTLASPVCSSACGGLPPRGRDPARTSCKTSASGILTPRCTGVSVASRRYGHVNLAAAPVNAKTISGGFPRAGCHICCFFWRIQQIVPASSTVESTFRIASRSPIIDL